MAVKVTGTPVFAGLVLDANVIVVVAPFTVCESAGDVLPVWVASPLYCAVIECDPTARVDVENVATPLPLSAEVPSVTRPSINVTVPVAPEDGLTVAENVTCCPNAEGLSDDVTAVVVPPVLADTICVSGAEVLPVKLVSPLNVAVMKCDPTARVEVVSEAVAPLRATVPSELPLSKNCTVPVGPENGLIVAVKVTGCPNNEGSSDEINAVAVLAGFTACETADDVLPVKLALPP